MSASTCWGVASLCATAKAVPGQARHTSRTNPSIPSRSGASAQTFAMSAAACTMGRCRLGSTGPRQGLDSLSQPNFGFRYGPSMYRPAMFGQRPLSMAARMTPMLCRYCRSSMLKYKAGKMLVTPWRR